MKIICEMKQDVVLSGTKMANDILRSKNFYDKVASKDSFDMSDATPKQISEFLENSDLEFIVKPFTPRGAVQRMKYKKTIALTDNRFPNILFLNTRRLSSEAESIAATIIHESIHALDNSIKDYSFGHGSNSSKGKNNTAPYWIGNEVYKILKNDSEINFDFVEIEEGIIDEV